MKFLCLPHRKNELTRQEAFLKEHKKHHHQVTAWRSFLFLFFLVIWEVAADRNWIDSFFFSSPSRIVRCFLKLSMGNDLFRFRDCLRGVLRNLKQMVFKKHLYVTVNGKKCRVLGHIGMLHTCVDVTKLPCAVGDTAVFDLKPLLLKGIEVVYR